MKTLALATTLLVTVGAARADTVAPPGEESGRVDPRHEDEESVATAIARGALFVPRYALRLGFVPVERGVWLVERYDVTARLHRLFWNDANTVGLLPTAQLESGFGLNLGAHLVLKDLLGRGERFDLRASGGGRFRQLVAASLRTDREQRVYAEANGELERRPKDAFYGIGNDDSLEARLRHSLMRATTTIDFRVTNAFHVRASGSLAEHEFEQSEFGVPIDELYMPETLSGFGGYRSGYAELELAWDTRRAGSIWEPGSQPSTGWLLAGFAGPLHVFGGTDAAIRYGFNAQRFIRLGAGPRTLILRSYVEGITGELADIPFDQLPRLGGKELLRGYPADRFRDRFAAVGSIDYRWDLNRALSASLFVDAGRVYSGPGDVTFDDLRVGYGIAVEAHSDKSFIARASLASSKDGGVFLDLAFDPVFDVEGRVQRR